MNGIICASCVTKRKIKETFANEGRALKIRKIVTTSLKIDNNSSLLAEDDGYDERKDIGNMTEDRISSSLFPLLYKGT
ncbi:hypothetical protein Tco_0304852 [Tanacetum coccineum]